MIAIPNSILQVQLFCSGPEPGKFGLRGENAYDILRVPESSTYDEIKASFRKLAKETHPDLAGPSVDSSYRFIQILAAYEILSDSSTRAHYDHYLLCERDKNKFVHNSTDFTYRSQVQFSKADDVVDWLRWYRLTIHDIVAEKRVAAGTGYFDEVEADFYSALRMAYYGPKIESLNLLPDCFEAEERSIYETAEVLHLVSGRDLFGVVCLADRINSISPSGGYKLDSCENLSLGSSNSKINASVSGEFKGSGTTTGTIHRFYDVCKRGDAYKDLELYISGRLVALAKRANPNENITGFRKEAGTDKICVYLCSTHNASCEGGCLMEPLGTITGVGTSEEGSCDVYDNLGQKTHVMLKHRTFLVKHMHWYGVRDNFSLCECRCSRARLPPSRFWLFEPRCGMHDIGGWYVETFTKDKRGRTVHSQRHWDGIDRSTYDERLHPAMYLFTLAYRTLDLEDAKRRKKNIVHVLHGQLQRAFKWCKKLV